MPSSIHGLASYHFACFLDSCLLPIFHGAPMELINVERHTGRVQPLRQHQASLPFCIPDGPQSWTSEPTRA